MAEVDDLTVAEAADALGTSAQTVRSLLRKGELRGQRRAWGSRYVWVPSRQGVDEFLSQYGRLDGRRRQRPPQAPEPEETPPPVPTDVPAEAPEVGPPEVVPSPTPEQAFAVPDAEPWDRRPFVLRPRGRATVIVIVLGVPVVLLYTTARILPGALWFEEVGQTDVFRRAVAARLEFYILVGVVVAFFVAVNLAIALWRTGIARTRLADLALAAVSLLIGHMFAGSAAGHWEQFLLWRHRQSFGVVDPVYGKDIGFFVFSLPIEQTVSEMLLWLVLVAAGVVAVVYRARGALAFRPLRASLEAQSHLACLAGVFLLVIAWRFQLERYSLELGQASPTSAQSFAGAGYVDVHVRLPGLAVLSVAAAVLAVAVAAAPLVARHWHRRAAVLLAGVPALLLLVGSFLVGGLIPAVVQRYVVDPNQLASEHPYLKRSIVATRDGLGLDTIEVERYSPRRSFDAADFSAVSDRIKNTLLWDSFLLEPRMRELVTSTPYYSPEAPSLDVSHIGGRRQLTVVSPRELDLRPFGGSAGSWSNERLAYTHGLGLIRFSGTDTVPGTRGPRLLDAGTGPRQPRIYFGNLPQLRVGPEPDQGEPKIYTPTTDSRTEEAPWVLVDTRRPEVDVPGVDGTSYHYTGSGGIELSNWVRRAMFALAFGSKELLLSKDITPNSRILLHRDVDERLQTLAPFIQWDTHAVPLTADGRIVFVVDGYTTSRSFPYSASVELGGSRVNYARATVRATVDAFTGRVTIYLTDPSEPIARAWAETFPTLFHPESEMPVELRSRLRYPYDLFAAQATAYEQFHTTSPDVVASNADAWTRPISLSGSIEVAGDVNFDESDEDELRLQSQPGYTLSPPPGQTRPRLLLGTYYSPREGQNLVGTLTGWIDAQGRTRLAARKLPHNPVTLGPAQISRLVFATPRVRNLLGLRNLEIRDLNVSSLDTVLLGRSYLFFLPGGVVQVQGLFEGSRGPGAARLLGITVYLNGQAGLGPDLVAAVRQALNDPPHVDVTRPARPVVVGEPVTLSIHVENAQQEIVTITSAAGRQRERLRVANGNPTVQWVPSDVGPAHVRVKVNGLDETSVADSVRFPVLSRAPTIKVSDRPKHPVVGKPVRLTFNVTHAASASVQVSTRGGIVFTRLYLLRNGTGVVSWTPKTSGDAVLLFRVGGHQGQSVRKKVHIHVAPSPKTPPPPTVTILRTPNVIAAGRPASLDIGADGCTVVIVSIEGPGGDVRTWRFRCPAARATVTWTPARPGSYLLKAIAVGASSTAQVSKPLTVGRQP